MLIKELQRLQEEHLAETKVKNFRSVSASGTGQLADTNWIIIFLFFKESKILFQYYCTIEP